MNPEVIIILKGSQETPPRKSSTAQGSSRRVLPECRCGIEEATAKQRASDYQYTTLAVNPNRAQRLSSIAGTRSRGRLLLESAKNGDFSASSRLQGMIL